MASAASVRALPVDGQLRWSSGWWGIVLLIANEAAFFAYLLFSYFYLASTTHASGPPHTPPKLDLAIPNTFILLASSGAVWWAERGIARNDRRRLTLGLLMAIVLGGVFLSIQMVEYARKAFGPSRDANASLFYTITGFHGAHVAIGLLMLAVILVRARLGHFTADRRVGVAVVAMYWHFVDIVWLAVFTSLYLSPRFA